MAEAAVEAPAEAAELATQWEALQLQQHHAEQLLQRQAALLERAGNGAKPAAGEVGAADAAREALRSQRAAVDECIAVVAAARIVSCTSIHPRATLVLLLVTSSRCSSGLRSRSRFAAPPSCPDCHPNRSPSNRSPETTIHPPLASPATQASWESDPGAPAAEAAQRGTARWPRLDSSRQVLTDALG